MHAALGHLGWGIADLLLGAQCAGCDTPGPPLCARCLALAHRTRTAARTVPGTGLRVTSATCYEGPTRAALIAHKADGRWALGQPLGRLLAAAVREALDDAGVHGAVTLVPVPSSRARVRARGYDHARALGAHASRALRSSGRDVSMRPMLRLRGREGQVGLSSGARALNRRGAIEVTPWRTARGLTEGTSSVVVVDDIMTTGASLASAVLVLRATGASVVAAAVVASVPRASRVLSSQLD